MSRFDVALRSVSFVFYRSNCRKVCALNSNEGACKSWQVLKVKPLKSGSQLWNFNLQVAENYVSKISEIETRVFASNLIRFLFVLLLQGVSSQCNNSWARVSRISSASAGKTESGTWFFAAEPRLFSGCSFTTFGFTANKSQQMETGTDIDLAPDWKCQTQRQVPVHFGYWHAFARTMRFVQRRHTFGGPPHGNFVVSFKSMKKCEILYFFHAM